MKEWFDFMGDDITFCMQTDCERKDCYRHVTKIRVPDIPHSFANMEGQPGCAKVEVDTNASV